jgi:hypothetical protein
MMKKEFKEKSVKEYAEEQKVTVQEIYRRIRVGKLLTRKIGKFTIITGEDETT